MKEKVIIFGAGEQGRKTFQVLSLSHNIIAFADNNISLAGSTILGTKIIQGCDIKKYCDDETDIVVSVYNHLPICCQLEEMGILNYYVMIDGELYITGGIQKEGEPVCTCSRCIMNNSSDKYILFKENGECNYCTDAIRRKKSIYFTGMEGKKRLDIMLKTIKMNSQGEKYDCIMGVSGGLDSSYLLYLGKKWGLRVLAIHIDDGYDTEISKRNLRSLINKTGFDYEVVVPDSEQFNDLTLAYMKSGVSNIAVPQDNVLFAFLYKKMKEYHIKYFLSGANYALECILQKGNTHNALDLTNLYAIHKKFGKYGIDKLEFISRSQVEEDKKVLGLETLAPLNYIDYNKNRALDELSEYCGFEYYGRKHLENILTAFAQLYWFPQKFGVDKRTSHLSSMIMSGQITRDEALEEINKPICEDGIMDEYIKIIKKRMGLTESEFDKIMNAPPMDHESYEHETGSIMY